jgi:DNA ligase-1
LKGGKGRWVGQNADVFVRLFSRHLEDITDKVSRRQPGAVLQVAKGSHRTSQYPDILDAMPILMGVDSDAGSSEVPKDAPRRAVQSFVVDAEVVALGPNGELLPFQTLASRGRKDVALASVKVRVG